MSTNTGKEELERVLATDPQDPQANEGMAKLLLDEGDAKAALPHILRCVEKGYANQRIRNFAAHHHAQNGDLQRAAQLVQGTTVPDDQQERDILFETYMMIGDDALTRGDTERAYEVARRAMDIPNVRSSVVDPIIVRAAMALAEKHVKSGRAEEALDVVKTALRFSPGNPKLAEIERLALESMGRKEAEERRRSTGRILGIVIPALIVSICVVAVAWIWLRGKNDRHMLPTAGEEIADDEPAGSRGEAPAAGEEEDASPAPVEKKMTVGEFFTDLWLKSQTDADMKGYAATLSSDFTGSTRAVNATKSAENARDGWLKKKSAALESKVEISVSNMSVEEIGGGDVKLTFDYQWSSKSYCDRGVKLLKLRPENDSWLVYREETVTALECTFASEATFLTFVTALGTAVRFGQWSYIKDHVILPVKLTHLDSEDRSEAKTLKDLREAPWLSGLRWAQIRTDRKARKDGGKVFVFDYAYGGGSTAELTVEVTIEETGEEYSSRFFFLFRDDRWYLEEHMTLVAPPEEEPEPDTGATTPVPGE